MKENYKFYVLQALYWAAQAAFSSYIASLALEKGFSESFVSLILSLGSVAGLGGMFFGSALSDILQSGKRLFLFTMMISLICNPGIYFAKTHAVFTCFYMAMSFLTAPAYSILDAWSLKRFHNDKTLYGHSRACGSAAYAVVILCMGKLIKHRGYGIPLLVSLALYALILGTGAGTQEAGSTPAEGVPRHSGKDLSFLKKRSYRMLSVCALFMAAAAAVAIRMNREEKKEEG